MTHLRISRSTGWVMFTLKAADGGPEELRDHARISAPLGGNLFISKHDIMAPCQVVNLSGSGACVTGLHNPPGETTLVLYINSFGRFDCVVARDEGGETGLHFMIGEAKRKRLIADLNAFVAQGLTADTRLRRHDREPSIAIGYYERHDGQPVACDVIDISLQGLSLRTDGRPPVGEIVNLGKTRGRVVRHHGDGIAIQFLMAVAPDPVRAEAG